jgi:catechol 2,3-dioxygenase-like lactoylglutathione lyase family enzyme
MKTLKCAIVLIALGITANLFAAEPAKSVQTTNQSVMSQTNSNIVSVRYMIDDVDAAVAFYTNHLGFHLDVDSSPAFASVVRGNLRLLLSGEKSSGHRALPGGTKPVPGSWNRILLEVSDINAEAARLRAAGVKFRREDIVSGPGGSQIWVVDPSGNLVELFQPK